MICGMFTSDFLHIGSNFPLDFPTIFQYGLFASHNEQRGSKYAAKNN